MLCYGSDVKLPPPYPTRQQRTEIQLNCYVFLSWSLELLSWSNNFVSGCKRALGWGWGWEGEGKSREIANVSLYWGGSPLDLTLELPACLLPHSHKGNTRLFWHVFPLSFIFQRKEG